MGICGDPEITRDDLGSQPTGHEAFEMKDDAQERTSDNSPASTAMQSHWLPNATSEADVNPETDKTYPYLGVIVGTDGQEDQLIWFREGVPGTDKDGHILWQQANYEDGPDQFDRMGGEPGHHNHEGPDKETGQWFTEDRGY